MFKHLVPVLAELALLAVGACVPSASVRAPAVSNDDPAVGDGLRQLRSATAAYKHFDVAVAAGYAPTAVCIIDEHHGAMGYHHLNPKYVDGVLDLTKPEMLLYERMPDSSYKLNGVEFMLPYRFWPRESVAPVLMGQRLHHENNYNYWYLHVWAWTDNPDGVFANMNPDVHCPDRGKVYIASPDTV